MGLAERKVDPFEFYSAIDNVSDRLFRARGRALPDDEALILMRPDGTETEAIVPIEQYRRLRACAATPDISLPAAVDTLNRERHRGHRRWSISGEGDDRVVHGADRYDTLTPFEAVAIAEKYLTAREHQAPSPAV
jgi:phosphoglycolate phosphatase-like HAD superfamily hydrolase